MQELPDWFRIKDFDKEAYKKTLDIIQDTDLNTVCISANCPNRYECFSNGAATFMILGDVCTRNCRYCNIESGKPGEVDKDEVNKIVDAVKKLKLRYVVITSVTRDDLDDKGTKQFVDVVNALKKIGCKVEVLIPDNVDVIEIIDAKPDVINHNLEVVRRLFYGLRPQGDYDKSLRLLKKVKQINPDMKTKSGIMVGLGESDEDIVRSLEDLKQADVDIVTIGQYLQPTDKHADVEKFYKPNEFESIKEKALAKGFKNVFSGPLVRSSYKAEEACGD